MKFQGLFLSFILLFSFHFDAYGQSISIAAHLVEFSGTVRVRRALEHTWKTLDKEVSLFEGDRVFVDSKSSARLKFNDSGNSLVAIGPRSIYEVKNTPPLSNIVLRGFDAGKGEILQVEKVARTLDGFVASAKSGKSIGGGKSDGSIQEAQVNAIDVQQRVTSLETLQPKGKTYLNAEKFPAYIRYRIKSKATDKHTLFGTLWRTFPLPKLPVWTGKLEQSNEHLVEGSVNISGEGVYFFQAQSKDGRVVAEVFEIEARELNSKSAADSSKILPGFIRPKETVVFE
jgi:hypothetical protein